MTIENEDIHNLCEPINVFLILINSISKETIIVILNAIKKNNILSTENMYNKNKS